MVTKRKNGLVWMLLAIPLIFGSLLFFTVSDVSCEADAARPGDKCEEVQDARTRTGLLLVGAGVVSLALVGWIVVRGHTRHRS